MIPGGKGKPGVEAACGSRVALEGEETLDSAADSETESGKSSVDMFGIRGGCVFMPPAMSVGTVKLLVLPAE